MPMYEYRCVACGETVDRYFNHDDEDRNALLACHCGGNMKRKFSLAFSPVLHTHFNPTVGKEVSSMRGFKDDLKRASDAATAATGIPHNFQPLSPSELKDAAALGVTDEGLKETHDHKVAMGEIPATPKLIT